MTSISQFHARFASDDDCLEHLFRQRFGPRPPCPDCGQPANWYRVRRSRVFHTNCCSKRHLSPQAKTLFDRSSLPLRIWFYAMLLFANSRSGVSSAFLASHLGISDRTAWRMASCIRLHMTALDRNLKLGGTGRIIRIGTTQLRGIRTPHVRGKGRMRLIGLADESCARAMPYAVRERHRLWHAVQPILRNGSVLVVDEPTIHDWLALRLQHQPPTAAMTLRFEPAATASNPLDGFFLALKRTLQRTHQHISRDSAERFIGEFAFRYNRRHRPDETFDDMFAAFPPIAHPLRSPKGSPAP